MILSTRLQEPEKARNSQFYTLISSLELLIADISLAVESDLDIRYIPRLLDHLAHALAIHRRVLCFTRSVLSKNSELSGELCNSDLLTPREVLRLEDITNVDRERKVDLVLVKLFEMCIKSYIYFLWVLPHHEAIPFAMEAFFPVQFPSGKPCRMLQSVLTAEDAGVLAGTCVRFLQERQEWELKYNELNDLLETDPRVNVAIEELKSINNNFIDFTHDSGGTEIIEKAIGIAVTRFEQTVNALHTLQAILIGPNNEDLEQPV